MTSLPNDESVVRLEKLHHLIENGVDPYPSGSQRTHLISKVLADFELLEKSSERLTVAGRIRAKRGHGGASFFDLEDSSGRIQIHLRQDVVGASAYDLFESDFDLGDFAQVTGKVFTTRRGEKSIESQEVVMLSKSLRPLPDKWHGLTDTEIRYRKRYLDLISNPEVKNNFLKRSLIVDCIREFLKKNGFMEVETPILQPLAGGATARPFVTHHNALDTDLFLRIAPELYLKRLIVGGFERVFEIARCFRNEGIDWSHNPEFTQVEFYQAYADYNDLMDTTEKFFLLLMKKVNDGSMKITYEKKEIDFTPPYQKVTFRDILIKEANCDIEEYPDRESMAKKAREMGLEVLPSDDRGKIMDEIFKKVVRPKIINPIFVINHPVELSPLAKKVPGDPRYVERFQLLVAGTELANSWSELNDPQDQQERFIAQEKQREAGDVEAMRIDEDFLRALEHGMPPTAGLGMGIDRLTALLTNSHNIKEVILFPTLKPENKNNEAI